MRNPKYAKKYERYDWLKQHGICVSCGQEDAFGNYIHCAKCIEKRTLSSIKFRTEHPEKMKEYEEKRREKRKNQRHERSQQGLCITCGKKADKGVYCLEHWLKRQRNREKEKVGRLRCGERWQIRKQSIYCLYCDKPKVEGYFFCEEHLNQKREIIKKHIAKSSETWRKEINRRWEYAKYLHNKRVLKEKDDETD